MKSSASRLLKVKRIVSRPSLEHPASNAALVTATVAAAAIRSPVVVLCDTVVLHWNGSKIIAD